MNCVIGLDIGTSAIKCVAVSEEIEIISAVEKKFEYCYPAVGQVVIDADKYLATVTAAIRELVDKLPANVVITSVCQASASGNLILLDEASQPLTPIFNWRDHRVNDEITRVFGNLNEREVYETIGWQLGTTFPLAILCWIKCHQPEILKKAAYITMSTEYLNYFLTGEWGISLSAGTPFYLIDQQRRKYHKPFLDGLGIDENQLPPIHERGTVIGKVKEKASEITGLPIGTPVMLGTFDHPSAAIAAEVTKQGQMMLSAGTSWVLFYPVQNREEAIKLDLLVDPFLSPNGCWGAMSSLTSASEKISGYVEQFIADGDDRFERLDELSAESIQGAGGLRINIMEPPDIPAVSMYEKRHIARAIMESAAITLREKMIRLERSGISADSVVMVGGPSKSKIWREVISYILHKEVIGSEGSFTGAVGAAKIALHKSLL